MLSTALWHTIGNPLAKQFYLAQCLFKRGPNDGTENWFVGLKGEMCCQGEEGRALVTGAASQLGSWQLENICICKKYLNYYQNYLRPNWINQVQHETGYCWGSITTWELCSACSIFHPPGPRPPPAQREGGGGLPSYNANVVTNSDGEHPATGHPLAPDMSGLDLIARCQQEAVMTSSPAHDGWPLVRSKQKYLNGSLLLCFQDLFQLNVQWPGLDGHPFQYFGHCGVKFWDIVVLCERLSHHYQGLQWPASAK